MYSDPTKILHVKLDQPLTCTRHWPGIFHPRGFEHAPQEQLGCNTVHSYFSLEIFIERWFLNPEKPPPTDMPERLSAREQPLAPAAISSRQDALRSLSRSPHPYHRQKFELPHSSENFTTRDATLRSMSHIPTSQPISDGNQDRSKSQAGGYRESTNSDSGTEADDEHFLKGLPAPKLRPHKGLRGADSSLSGSPSPLLSPTILEEFSPRTPGFRRTTLPSIFLNEEEARKAEEKFRAKRRVEVARRLTEAALLMALGGLVCQDPKARSVIKYWRAGERRSNEL